MSAGLGQGGKAGSVRGEPPKSVRGEPEPVLSPSTLLRTGLSKGTMNGLVPRSAHASSGQERNLIPDCAALHPGTPLAWGKAEMQAPFVVRRRRRDRRSSAAVSNHASTRSVDHQVSAYQVLLVRSPSTNERMAPSFRSWFDELTTNGRGEGRSWIDRPVLRFYVAGQPALSKKIPFVVSPHNPFVVSLSNHERARAEIRSFPDRVGMTFSANSARGEPFDSAQDRPVEGNHERSQGIAYSPLNPFGTSETCPARCLGPAA
jgi:hypothetical protein